jgi:probable DNA repair protein
MLDRFAALGALVGPVDGEACVARLRRLAGDTIFQPESESAPIQVLGLQESAGLQFDALWIGGLSHQAWPRPLRPNPLLPVALQRRHGIPRTSANEELEFARLKTRQLAGAADQVIFSWPSQDADETLRASPLIAALPAIEVAAPPPSVWAGLQLEGAQLEAVTDYRLPAWPADQRVRGGTGVLRAQSACPFQAQALYRLDARPLETPLPGVSHLQRGQIAHLALQWLWADWRSLDGMLALDAQQRAEQIRAAVTRAAHQSLRRQSRMDARLSRLEGERLSERITELLVCDAGRAPFEVESVEEDAEWTLAGLRLRIRADRVDRLADGGLLYVDYKTGAAAVGDWLERRPRQPQLPLYALAAGSRVAGIAYGMLAAGQVGYTGLARDAIEATTIEAPASNRRTRAAGLDTWDKLLRAWHAWLSDLATAFVDGEAGVRPRRIAEDCRYCHLAVLCRRHELRQQGVQIDE